MKDYYTKDVTIVIHDFDHPCWKWKAPRIYLENNGYSLLWSFTEKYGFGVYKKTK